MEGGREGGRAGTYLESVHVEEDAGVVLGVDRDEGILPIDGREGTREGGREGGQGRTSNPFMLKRMLGLSLE